ncbi:hypothetical protein ANN_17362 [Periplaneta americana]|uniref:Uncharacterized protein n=1 Tax=Periplaneta americana TaxID=6978 RepID=A0ABQ8SU51_PERAM|nr:hypothetical protein ANN_17362 [Periplaneta americana]
MLHRKNCNARCVTNVDFENIRILTDGTGNHLHPPNVTEARVRQVLNGIRRRGRGNPTESPGSVVRQDLAGVHNEQIIQLPKIANGTKQKVCGWNPDNPVRTSLLKAGRPLEARGSKTKLPMTCPLSPLQGSASSNVTQIPVQQFNHLASGGSPSKSGPARTSEQAELQRFVAHDSVWSTYD